MAMKPLLLFSAFMLVVTTRVSSVEDEMVSQNPPTMAPIYFFYPPEYPPTHPPKVVPAPAPTSAVIPKYCAWQCLDYCKPYKKAKRMCQRICSTCCSKCKCVPMPGKPKCRTWDKVMYHGILVKCP